MCLGGLLLDQSLGKDGSMYEVYPPIYSVDKDTMHNAPKPKPGLLGVGGSSPAIATYLYFDICLSQSGGGGAGTAPSVRITRAEGRPKAGPSLVELSNSIHCLMWGKAGQDYTEESRRVEDWGRWQHDSRGRAGVLLVVAG